MMKKFLLMMLTALLAVNVMADNVKFKISNMNCQNCANRVEKALKANKAVTNVEVNLECKAVCVSYDAQKTNVEALQKALTDVKFKTEIAKQCDKKEGCKHDGKKDCKHEGKKNCKHEGKKDCKHEGHDGEHKCGAEGCGHEKETKK